MIQLIYINADLKLHFKWLNSSYLTKNIYKTRKIVCMPINKWANWKVLIFSIIWLLYKREKSHARPTRTKTGLEISKIFWRRIEDHLIACKHRGYPIYLYYSNRIHRSIIIYSMEINDQLLMVLSSRFLMNLNRNGNYF